MSDAARLDRRGWLCGLVGTGAWAGLGAPAWAGPVQDGMPSVICVDLPAARALAGALATEHAPAATQRAMETLAAPRLADPAAWQALALRLQGRPAAVIAVLDERALVLWDAVITPSARHTAHRVQRGPGAVPLHVLLQRFA